MLLNICKWILIPWENTTKDGDPRNRKTAGHSSWGTWGSTPDRRLEATVARVAGWSLANRGASAARRVQ